MKINAADRRKRRVRAKVYGKVTRPRLTVSRTNTGMFAQIINDDAGKTLVGLSTKGLKDKLKGKTKVESASLLGEELAALAKKKKITKVVFDRGEYRYLGRIKALAEGARKGGLDF